MLAPDDDPEATEGRGRAPRGKGRIESDVRCPWCSSERLQVHKKMPNPRGLGILAYVFFPIALGYWLSSTTFNVCLDCGGRWQRGLPIAPKRPKPQEDEGVEPEVRAGMYARQVPAAAVVRRRPRLGAERPAVAASGGEVVLKASPGACRRCREAAGRYDARDVPALPIVGCTCEGGCTCTVAPAED